MQNKYYTTAEGYNNLLQRLNEVNREVFENPEHSQYLLSIKRDIERRLDRSVIIEVPILDDDQVNIDDQINLRFIFAADDIEEGIYTLVADEVTMGNNEISLNSPIGKAIFQRRIGDVVNYKVNGQTFEVVIMDKVRNRQL